MSGRHAVRAQAPAVPGPLALLVALLVVALLAWAAPGAFGGFSARITNGVNTAGTATAFTCTDADLQDRATALFQWPLTDTGATATDLSGNARIGTHVGGTVTSTTPPLACPRDAGPAWSLDGSTQYAYLPGLLAAPSNAFTLEVWFQTTAAQGRLIGFGSAAIGASLSDDRQLYITSGGTLAFGVFSSTYRTTTTTATVTDGAWHQAVATLSPTTGTVLYLDGKPVIADPATTAGQAYPLGGYWRVGYDTLAGWPQAPSSGFFKGRLRFAAVYTSALSATQVAVHYRAGT